MPVSICRLLQRSERLNDHHPPQPHPAPPPSPVTPGCHAQTATILFYCFNFLAKLNRRCTSHPNIKTLLTFLSKHYLALTFAKIGKDARRKNNRYKMVDCTKTENPIVPGFVVPCFESLALKRWTRNLHHRAIERLHRDAHHCGRRDQ